MQRKRVRETPGTAFVARSASAISVRARPQFCQHDAARRALVHPDLCQPEAYQLTEHLADLRGR